MSLFIIAATWLNLTNLLPHAILEYFNVVSICCWYSPVRSYKLLNMKCFYIPSPRYSGLPPLDLCLEPPRPSLDVETKGCTPGKQQLSETQLQAKL